MNEHFNVFRYSSQESSEPFARSHEAEVLQKPYWERRVLRFEISS
jgi:hypothetical protein